jgi:hypothetical protein
MKSVIHQPARPNPGTGDYDVVVCGATPAGIAAAVRAARGGLRVLLTQHTAHLGGMCTNGLGQWDAQSDHRRCPLYGEILDALEAHYREVSGEGSPDHLAARYSVKYPVGAYEPSVIEGIFRRMVEAEKNITVWFDVYPARANVRDGIIASVELASMTGPERRTVRAESFVDATYEGDLAALVGAPYRVGREAGDEFDEPHAGRIFTRILSRPAPDMAVDGRLNLQPFSTRMGGVSPDSPRSADGCIQAYNLRACVSRDPATRILLERPPEDYDRQEFLNYKRHKMVIKADIRGKNSYNGAILPGENWDYPEGDWATRERITRRHTQFALGLMWFLQNDPSLPAETRERFGVWGLPADEYTDNGHLPYEMYVRETRRLVGRHVLTENDLTPAPGRMRPACFTDSIAFTDWYMDSHSCRRDAGTYREGNDLSGLPEFPYDGKLILTENFRPGMIPYRSLVAAEIRNLIVPVCASSTHVAWGSIRLEPCWIHLGEVAGFAVCQARAGGEPLNALDVTRLQKTLLEAGAAIAFFNQHRAFSGRADEAERQLAACHGQWDSYNTDRCAS